MRNGQNNNKRMRNRNNNNNNNNRRGQNPMTSEPPILGRLSRPQ